MNLTQRRFQSAILPYATLILGWTLFAGSQFAHTQAAEPVCEPSVLGSPYIPVDSWVYPAVLRLYSLGFVDNVFLGMRPWTRASLSHMLEAGRSAHRGCRRRVRPPTRRKASTRR